MSRVHRCMSIVGFIVAACGLTHGPVEASSLPEQFVAAGPILEASAKGSQRASEPLTAGPTLEFLAAGPISVAPGALLETADADILGESLPELLAMARKLNPEIAASILDARAAESAAEAAGALDDPEFSVSLEDTGRSSTGLPERVGTAFYQFDQRLPWWGKRGLQRAVAQAETERSKAGSHTVRLELEARLKQAFVEGWLASEAIAITQKTQRDLRAVADLTTERYRLGLARQSEVSDAEIAASEAAAEKIRLEAALAGAKARINALLDRDPNAPLKSPASLPPMPSSDALKLEYLVDRAMADSPVLAERRAALAGARDGRRLAEKDWYPDFTVGFSVVDGLSKNGSEDGYEARFGINLPLQWGVRRARLAEASAKLGAADNRVRSAERELQASLATSLSALEASRRRAEILAQNHLRQATAALASIEASYPLGRARRDPRGPSESPRHQS
jgi:outer membrane protein, heavy metal efflux system